MSAKCPACGERIWVPFPHQLGNTATSGADDPEEFDGIEDEVAADGDHSDALDERDVVPGESVQPRSLMGTVGDDAWLDDEAEQDSAASSGRGRRCRACGAENQLSDRECFACGATLLRRGQRRHGRQQVRSLPDTHVATEEQMTIGGLMSDTWKIYSEDLAAVVIGPFLLSLAISAVSLPIFICGIATGVGALLIVPPAIAFTSALAAVGVNFVYFKAARGERPGIGDAFAAFSAGSGYLGSMFLLMILIGLMTFLGLLLLVVPGLLLMMISWTMTRAMIDENLDAVGAVSRGWRLSMDNFERSC
ncbi:MAG: hypothetical protein R3B90_06440 [Planctomycetaceae bacterium]